MRKRGALSLRADPLAPGHDFRKIYGMSNTIVDMGSDESLNVALGLARTWQ